MGKASETAASRMLGNSVVSAEHHLWAAGLVCHMASFSLARVEANGFLGNKSHCEK